MTENENENILINWDLLNQDFETEEKKKKQKESKKVENFLKKFEKNIKQTILNHKSLPQIFESSEFKELLTIDEDFEIENSHYSEIMKVMMISFFKEDVYNSINEKNLVNFKEWVLKKNNYFLTEKMNFWELSALLNKVGLTLNEQEEFYKRWFEETHQGKKENIHARGFLSEKDALLILQNIKSLGITNLFDSNFDIHKRIKDYYSTYYKAIGNESETELQVKIIDIMLSLVPQVSYQHELELQLNKALIINEFKNKGINLHKKMEITDYLIKNVKIKELYEDFFIFNSGFKSVLDDKDARKNKYDDYFKYNGPLKAGENLFLLDIENNKNVYNRVMSFCKIIKSLDKDVMINLKEKEDSEYLKQVSTNREIYQMMMKNINRIKNGGILEYKGKILKITNIIDDTNSIKKLKTLLTKVDNKIKEEKVDLNDKEKITELLNDLLGKSKSNKVLLNDFLIDIEKLSNEIGLGRKLFEEISFLERNLNQYMINEERMKKQTELIAKISNVIDLDIKFFEENYDKIVLWVLELDEYRTDEIAVFAKNIKKTNFQNEFIASKLLTEPSLYRKGFCESEDLKSALNYVFENREKFNDFKVNTNFEYLIADIVDKSKLMKYIDLNTKIDAVFNKIKKIKSILELAFDEEKQNVLNKEEIKYNKLNDELVLLGLNNENIEEEFNKISSLLMTKNDKQYNGNHEKIRRFIIEYKIRKGTLEIDNDFCEKIDLVASYWDKKEINYLLENVENFVAENKNISSDQIIGERVKILYIYNMLGLSSSLNNLLSDSGFKNKEQIKEEMVKSALSSRLLLKKVGDNMFMEEDLMDIISKPQIWQDRNFVVNYLREIDNKNLIFLAFLISAPLNVKTVIHNWHRTGVNCESFFQKSELEQKMLESKKVNEENNIRGKKKI